MNKVPVRKRDCIPLCNKEQEIQKNLADVEDAIGGKLIARPAALIIR
ncbi:hypothetical protein RX717_08360 [Intestinibacillus sp. NTUH-41-i26]|nr:MULTISPECIES: hypothetical protein [Butyricicoccaceae]MBS6884250.1 hypothetical protein [Clostridiaceae bacterium]WOC74045.1 hypothetical protein RX717_08360 [Intestinibacillus sp. NTUH-41-i26]